MVYIIRWRILDRYMNRMFVYDYFELDTNVYMYVFVFVKTPRKCVQKYRTVLGNVK